MATATKTARHPKKTGTNGGNGHNGNGHKINKLPQIHQLNVEDIAISKKKLRTNIYLDHFSKGVSEKGILQPIFVKKEGENAAILILKFFLMWGNIF